MKLFINVNGESGLHIRPVTVIADILKESKNIEMLCGEDSELSIDASSPLSMLSLGAGKGSKLLAKVQGENLLEFKEILIKKLEPYDIKIEEIH